MKCPLCRDEKYSGNPDMEQHTLPTAPIGVGSMYDRRSIQVEIMVCPNCYFWVPCTSMGVTQTDEIKETS
jgi:hypothetical protein